MIDWIAGAKTIYDFVDRILTFDKDVKKAKTDKVVAKINADSKKEVAKINADSKQTKSLADVDKVIVATRKVNGWQMALLSIIVFGFFVALVLSFIPQYQPQIKEGFKTIALIPDLLWYFILSTLAVMFGGMALLKSVASHLFGKK